MRTHTERFLLTLDVNKTKRLLFWCPGCDDLHQVIVELGDNRHLPLWDWDQDLDRPTISPSIKVHGAKRGQPMICHSYLRGGRIEYLPDSTHYLAGSEPLDLPILPPWLIRDGRDGVSRS